jgi:hypothetical protein
LQNDGGFNANHATDAANKVNWAELHAAAKAATTTSASAAAPVPEAKLGVGDTSKDGSYPGFTRYDNNHKSLGAAMDQRDLTSAESNALSSYKGSGYSSINAQLREGKMLSGSVLAHAAALSSGTRAGTVPANTILYRGMPDYEELGLKDLENAVKTGKGWHDNGFLSVTTSRDVADHWSLGGNPAGPKSVLFEMKITKPVPGVHIARTQGGSDGEQEVVMPAQTFWKITGVRKGTGTKKWVVTMETA